MLQGNGHVIDVTHCLARCRRQDLDLHCLYGNQALNLVWKH